MQAKPEPRRRGPLAAALVALACLVQAAPVTADSPHARDWDRHEHEYKHKHKHKHTYYQHPHYRYAPPHYVVVERLPYGSRHVVYRGAPYYYHGGYWYRPHGELYARVAPPAGLIIDARGVTLAARVPLVRW